MITNALKLAKIDNVATAMEDIEAGDTVLVTDKNGDRVGEYPAARSIPRGHKIAIEAISKDADIVKYGYPIGIAVSEIKPGDYVHTHNLFSARGRGDL